MGEDGVQLNSYRDLMFVFGSPPLFPQFHDTFHTTMTITLYSDIDWQQLWQNARQRKSWSSKNAADWDKKAPSFARRNRVSAYIDLLMARLPLSSELTVLDAGSGPGTLSLPMANRVKQITALDYSAGMLEILEQECQAQGISNIRPVHASWEDDWQPLDIGVHDLAIASRSLAVDELGLALGKLNDHASQAVFITDRIAPTPFDPAAFAAIEREFESGPDYIYTLNTLYSMGIHANVEVLALEQEMIFPDFEHALDSYRWMIKDLSEVEEAKLTSYLRSRIIAQSNEQITIRREHPPRWALIWWKKENSSSP